MSSNSNTPYAMDPSQDIEMGVVLLRSPVLIHAYRLYLGMDGSDPEKDLVGERLAILLEIHVKDEIRAGKSTLPASLLEVDLRSRIVAVIQEILKNAKLAISMQETAEAFEAPATSLLSGVRDDDLFLRLRRPSYQDQPAMDAPRTLLNLLILELKVHLQKQLNLHRHVYDVERDRYDELRKAGVGKGLHHFARIRLICTQIIAELKANDPQKLASYEAFVKRNRKGNVSKKLTGEERYKSAGVFYDQFSAKMKESYKMNAWSVLVWREEDGEPAFDFRHTREWDLGTPEQMERLNSLMCEIVHHQFSEEGECLKVYWEQGRHGMGSSKGKGVEVDRKSSRPPLLPEDKADETHHVLEETIREWLYKVAAWQGGGLKQKIPWSRMSKAGPGVVFANHTECLPKRQIKEGIDKMSLKYLQEWYGILVTLQREGRPPVVFVEDMLLESKPLLRSNAGTSGSTVKRGNLGDLDGVRGEATVKMSQLDGLLSFDSGVLDKDSATVSPVIAKDPAIADAPVITALPVPGQTPTAGAPAAAENPAIADAPVIMALPVPGAPAPAENYAPAKTPTSAEAPALAPVFSFSLGSGEALAAAEAMLSHGLSNGLDAWDPTFWDPAAWDPKILEDYDFGEWKEDAAEKEGNGGELDPPYMGGTAERPELPAASSGSDASASGVPQTEPVNPVGPPASGAAQAKPKNPMGSSASGAAQAEPENPIGPSGSGVAQGELQNPIGRSPSPLSSLESDFPTTPMSGRSRKRGAPTKIPPGSPSKRPKAKKRRQQALDTRAITTEIPANTRSRTRDTGPQPRTAWSESTKKSMFTWQCQEPLKSIARESYLSKSYPDLPSNIVNDFKQAVSAVHCLDESLMGINPETFSIPEYPGAPVVVNKWAQGCNRGSFLRGGEKFLEANGRAINEWLASLKFGQVEVMTDQEILGEVWFKPRGQGLSHVLWALRMSLKGQKILKKGEKIPDFVVTTLSGIQKVVERIEKSEIIMQNYKKAVPLPPLRSARYIPVYGLYIPQSFPLSCVNSEVL
ncbi:hypothetical protein K435DRAFT_807639 [Dendrothele bispora CBS 962.96]|uniref:Uncharacterized protein n=1 Tax=Dendrothele bispora (strain CBS 962.96) TaxID=1314807 RepID=A0A4S8L4M5_DENBC|nr:hypothetical protein K435DRAFT_807639 [Dendrothele bispora CBS 962.96]